MADIWGILAAIEQKKPVDRDGLRQAIAEEEAYRRRIRGKRPIDEGDSLWRLFLLHRKNQQQREACDDLKELLEIVETMRSRMRDPRLRPTFVGRFPHLYAELCRLQFAFHRYDAAFRTIECSKGRVLADLVSDGQAAVPSIGIQALRNGLKELALPGIHYLTALVTPESVFLILVTPAGLVHPHAVELSAIVAPFEEVERRSGVYQGACTLSRLVDAARKRHWQPKRGHILEPAVDYTAFFATLVDWLESYLVEGGHLVFCPDGELYDVPLHLLPFRGDRLGNFVSVSRSQGVQSLLTSLTQPPVSPKRGLCFSVPSSEDARVDDKKSKQAKLDALYSIAPTLRVILSEIEDVRDGEADLARLEGSDLTRAVLHLGVHGYPPKEAYAETAAGGDRVSPLQMAGLMLAHEGALPAVTDFADPYYPGRLTPRRILTSVGRMTGSHVSLMACVSGLVREGPAGDALSLEWAFLQRGASSVLSTYWDVDAAVAAEFFQQFYVLWLDGGLTRATACQKAMAAVAYQMQDGDGNAFCISGDWR